ncbi:ABC transporter permease [Alphaproteobacteria bacterium]|nr:ABC transporter permease [Alphaproteobacteria bacterium]
MIDLKFNAAGQDVIVAATSKSWIWLACAAQDIRLRYRGSVLGPFWITISTLILISIMGVVYSKVLRIDLQTYLPYLTIGLIFWQFISTVMNEGCHTFSGVHSIIQQAPLPLSLHAFRVVTRNVIVLGHTFVLVPLVLFIYDFKVSVDMLMVIPAFILILINGLWVTILVGMICARFRDMPSVVANIVQIMFFVTPIFWSPSALGEYKYLVELNPFFAVINLIRAPLLGQQPESSSWIILIAITILGCLVTFVFFAKFRHRIAFWI